MYLSLAMIAHVICPTSDLLQYLLTMFYREFTWKLLAKEIELKLYSEWNSNEGNIVNISDWSFEYGRMEFLLQVYNYIVTHVLRLTQIIALCL